MSAAIAFAIPRPLSPRRFGKPGADRSSRAAHQRRRARALGSVRANSSVCSASSARSSSVVTVSSAEAWTRQGRGTGRRDPWQPCAQLVEQRFERCAVSRAPSVGSLPSFGCGSLERGNVGCARTLHQLVGALRKAASSGARE